MEYFSKRIDENRPQYVLRVTAAVLAVLVLAPVAALAMILVPAVMVLELPPFLLALVVGVLTWGIVRLRHGILGAPATARHNHRA